MSRRGFIFGTLLPAALFVVSVGVDIADSMVSRRPAAAGSGFPKPGPRRYPPGYQPDRSALSAR